MNEIITWCICGLITIIIAEVRQAYAFYNPNSRRHKEAIDLKKKNKELREISIGLIFLAYALVLLFWPISLIQFTIDYIKSGEDDL